MVSQAPVDHTGQTRYRRQFFKTSMCIYHLENACRKGDLCSHAHSSDELLSKPVLSKTRMCKQVLRSGRCADSDCTFAHEIEELIEANTFFRTKMCEFHLTGNGCKLGDKCRYAHSVDQLNATLPEQPVVLNSQSPKDIPPVDFNDSPDTGYPLRKRGSMSSRTTIASSSYSSLGNFAAVQQPVVVQPVPMVFLYSSGFAPYYMTGRMEAYED